MPDFKTLRIMPLIRSTVVGIYHSSATFPVDERYGLASQMRRAAISIGANVAEGTGRSSDGDFARFVNIARGSSHELEFHVLVASDLGLLDTVQAEGMLEEVRRISRMLHALSKRLRQPHQPSALSLQPSALLPGTASGTTGRTTHRAPAGLNGFPPPRSAHLPGPGAGRPGAQC
jgi:four helix bundle protein